MLEILREHFFFGLDHHPSLTTVYLMILAAIVLATTVHEFGHAWMADRLGDPMPREQGRVTLNPLAHLDPLGSLLLVVTMLIGFPVGWGKPVRTNPEKYTCGARKGSGLVAFAGPVMNFLLAVVLGPFTRMAIDGQMDYIAMFLIINMLINLSLFCFNLVPIHPLDGSHIAASLMPEPLARPYRAFMQRYGVFLLLGLMYTKTLGKFLAPIIISLFLLLIGK